MGLMRKIIAPPYRVFRKGLNLVGYHSAPIPRSTAVSGPRVLTIPGGTVDFLLDPVTIGDFGGFDMSRAKAVYVDIRKRVAGIDPALDFPIQGYGDASLDVRGRILEYVAPGRIGQYLATLRWSEECGMELADKDVIDIGTGAGVLPFLLKQRWTNARVSGSDGNISYVQVANALFPEVSFRQAMMQDEEGQFDAVYFTEILEHLVDPRAALAQLGKLVRQGGYLVISVPDGRADQMLPYKLSRTMRSYSGHINYWSIESWTYLLRSAFPGQTISVGAKNCTVLFACVRF
jgi:2-polyprenyl-3-methyl-5-hydroxy-6-metoxy-1,4-benzoquinol methylase